MSGFTLFIYYSHVRFHLKSCECRILIKGKNYMLKLLATNCNAGWRKVFAVAPLNIYGDAKRINSKSIYVVPVP